MVVKMAVYLEWRLAALMAVLKAAMKELLMVALKELSMAAELAASKVEKTADLMAVWRAVPKVA